MLETTYQEALECELRFRCIPFRARVSIPLRYRDERVGELIADVIVDGKIVVELEAAEKCLPVHRAQVFSYLGATRCKLGRLINFNVCRSCDDVSRVVR